MKSREGGSRPKSTGRVTFDKASFTTQVVEENGFPRVLTPKTKNAKNAVDSSSFFVPDHDDEKEQKQEQEKEKDFTTSYLQRLQEIGAAQEEHTKAEMRVDETKREENVQTVKDKTSQHLRRLQQMQQDKQISDFKNELEEAQSQRTIRTGPDADADAETHTPIATAGTSREADEEEEEGQGVAMGMASGVELQMLEQLENDLLVMAMTSATPSPSTSPRPENTENTENTEIYTRGDGITTPLESFEYGNETWSAWLTGPIEDQHRYFLVEDMEHSQWDDPRLKGVIGGTSGTSTRTGGNGTGTDSGEGNRKASDAGTVVDAETEIELEIAVPVENEKEEKEDKEDKEIDLQKGSKTSKSSPRPSMPPSSAPQESDPTSRAMQRERDALHQLHLLQEKEKKEEEEKEEEEEDKEKKAFADAILGLEHEGAIDPEEQEVEDCWRCKASISRTSKFCTSCGAKQTNKPKKRKHIKERPRTAKEQYIAWCAVDTQNHKLETSINRQKEKEEAAKIYDEFNDPDQMDLNQLPPQLVSALNSLLNHLRDPDAQARRDAAVAKSEYLVEALSLEAALQVRMLLILLFMQYLYFSISLYFYFIVISVSVG